MDERSGTIRLVESHPDGAGRTLVATVARSDVQEALRTHEPVDLAQPARLTRPGTFMKRLRGAGGSGCSTPMSKPTGCEKGSPS